MKFYLYPLQKIDYRIKWAYDQFFYKRWYKEAYSALLQHPERTNDPNLADFYVVSFTLMCLSFVGFNKQDLENRLTQLPYWNEGHKHVVFDFTDLPKTFYSNSNVSVFKSAFSVKNYDPTKDVSIPQFPRYRFTTEMVNEYAQHKNKLLSFKGHPRKGHNPIRDLLFEMNDDTELYVQEFSNNPKDFEFQLKNTMEITPSKDPMSYLNLLFTSRFSLLPRGNGWALSYRHIEAMNVGSIPVIISDDYQLPFSEHIDWSSCSVRIPESQVSQTLDIVKQEISKEEILRNNVNEIYQKYFSSTEKIIHTAIEIYSSKLATTTITNKTL